MQKTPLQIIRKLRDRCLNREHEEGKHEAYLFSTILGMDEKDAEEPQTILLETVLTGEAKIGRRDVFGQRYPVDFMLRFPRLTTCYPL